MNFTTLIMLIFTAILAIGLVSKGLSFDPEHVQDHGWTPNDWKYKFNPDHVKDVVGVAQHTQTEISPIGVEIETSKLVQSDVHWLQGIHTGSDKYVHYLYIISI